MTSRLYNRGPHRDAYRGEVVVGDDGVQRWACTETPVDGYHGDFLSDADPDVLLRQSRVS